MLCAPCLISGVDTDAVTQVEGTAMCRDHGATFASVGRVRAMAFRSSRQVGAPASPVTRGKGSSK